MTFSHDFPRFHENIADDRRAIETLGAALRGAERPMLVRSGVAGVADGRAATEADGPAEKFSRLSEVSALEMVQQRGHASSIRLAPSTRDVGDHGFIPHLINLPHITGVSAFVGEGSNRWPAVHRRDAARLFRLAIERGAKGQVYHAADELRRRVFRWFDGDRIGTTMSPAGSRRSVSIAQVAL